MKSRFGSVLAWICTILVAAFNIFAGIMKFMPVAPGSEAEIMGQRLGLTPQIDHVLGVIELIIVALYLIPRTSTVGFVLLIGYMSGALATNITHGFTPAECAPMYVTLVLMTIAAYFRNPELLTRLKTGRA